MTTGSNETLKAIFLVPETNHAVILPQHFVIDLLVDDQTIDPFGALHRALVPPVTKEVLGALLSGHSRCTIRKSHGIEYPAMALSPKSAESKKRNKVWLV
jgi:hypothetical protein